MSSPALFWNEALGLIRQEGPGHTAPMAGLPAVHNAVNSATHLCLRVQHGCVDEAELMTTLRTFRAMQQRLGTERAGCLRWYWEESAPVDTNASFFIGLALELLYLAERENLGVAPRATIREIVADLVPWFEHELTDANPRYPNKCLGDLVCTWLATEVLESAPSALLMRTTREWTAYWQETHWGWGEHMSDIYAMVLLTELSAVLLFARNLPVDIREVWQTQFKELLRIEDVFAGGPRVPLIRSYAFTETPPVMPFRGYIRDVARDGRELDLIVRKQAEAFGAWFFCAGWSRLAGNCKPASTPWIEVACHQGAVARAIVRPNLRVGAMSRYPIMDGVDQQTWGLSWQSFPAALWRPAGDWGFWRWTTREGDRVRAHPALDLASAYLGNALSARVDPPPVPRMTATLTADGHLVMERVLPTPAGVAWDWVEDEFCLFNSSVIVRAGGDTLELRWPDAVVTVRWRGDAPIRWEPAGCGGRWVARYSAEQLVGWTELSHHWELALD